MGSRTSAPVNEAANFLSRVAPSELATLRSSFPEIAEDLRPGMMAGDNEEVGEHSHKKVLLAKGRLMLAALKEARRLSDAAITKAAARLQQGSKVRFGGQIITTVASSGVLGALGATKTTLAAVAAVLALLSSVATLAADFLERIVNPGHGNLSEIYLSLADARYKAGSLYDAIAVQIEYENAGPSLEKLIADGNALCETINKSVYQVIQGMLESDGTRPIFHTVE